MGDTLMYSLLPLEAASLGIPLALVGVLLSANRIVRLASNPLASRAFERWGPRVPFIFAALLGFVSTVFYGGRWGFAVFLLARAIWGVAWSAFRQGGYQAVWAMPESIKGRMMGALWGITRLGSAASVLLGGYIYDRYGYLAAVAVIAAGTFLAFPAALTIRWPDQIHTEEDLPALSTRGLAALRSVPHRWALGMGFMDTLFEGVLVSTASLFLAEQLSDSSITLAGIGTLAGLLLAVRFIANIVFAPLLGSLSDRLGQPRTLALLAFFMLASTTAAVFAPSVWPLLFLVLAFFAASGTYTAVSAAASGLARRTEQPHRFMGLFSTALDVGAAIGPLLAYWVGPRFGFGALYAALAGLYLLAALRFRRMHTEPAPVSDTMAVPPGI